MIKAYIWGCLTVLLVLLAGGYWFITGGMMPANADSKPPALEKWAARASLHATIHREAPKGANPAALNDENLIEGIHLYAANCAVCHGASDGKASNIAVGLYQPAPQLARDGVEDDPEGVTFWKVKHGIRLTGMPGFSRTLSDEKIWKITLFLKHMDDLTPGAKPEWQKVPDQEPLS
jgi:mono/diheme cytochrome c family protein